MSVSPGAFARIVIDGATVAEMGTYTMSGFTRDVLEKTAFGDLTKKFTAGQCDGGEISFSGFYDLSDTTGQRVLEAAAKTRRIMSPGALKVYIDEVYYFTVGSSGTMFVTKAGGVGMDNSGLGTTAFTVKVAGDELVLYPAASLSVSASPSASPSKSPSKSASVSPSLSPST